MFESLSVERRREVAELVAQFADGVVGDNELEVWALACCGGGGKCSWHFVAG